jgi:predicted RNA-binding Zn-ribbon protein involved in translation (DUF1610 family)
MNDRQTKLLEAAMEGEPDGKIFIFTCPNCNDRMAIGRIDMSRDLVGATCRCTAWCEMAITKTLTYARRIKEDLKAHIEVMNKPGLDPNTCVL